LKTLKGRGDFTYVIQKMKTILLLQDPCCHPQHLAHKLSTQGRSKPKGWGLNPSFTCNSHSSECHPQNCNDVKPTLPNEESTAKSWMRAMAVSIIGT
jgi:hypothetical protein